MLESERKFPFLMLKVSVSYQMENSRRNYGSLA
jgi:hypothetical protein